MNYDRLNSITVQLIDFSLSLEEVKKNIAGNEENNLNFLIADAGGSNTSIDAEKLLALAGRGRKKTFLQPK